MNSALMLCTNAIVRYNVLKVTKLQCFSLSNNKAYSLLTFGIQLLNSSMESDAAMKGSLSTYVTLH